MASRKPSTPTTWKPGQSGNPAGRKPGSEVVRQLLEPHRADLVQKAVSLALAGDSTALRICIDRLAPPPRAESPKVSIPALANAPTLSAKSEAIIGAVAAGDLSADTASMLLQAMAAACKVVECEDFERRLRALEAA